MEQILPSFFAGILAGFTIFFIVSVIMFKKTRATYKEIINVVNNTRNEWKEFALELLENLREERETSLRLFKDKVELMRKLRLIKMGRSYKNGESISDKE